MIIYSIYRATCTINNKSYIGFASNFNQRHHSHKHSFNTGAQTVLYNAMRKHGWDSFTWDIIYQSTDKDYTKNVMEEYFIREYDTYVDNGNGYNMTYGGDGNNGHSQRTLDKLRAARLGKTMGPCTEETKRLISITKKAQGLHTSDKQKEQIRKARIGSKASTESKLKRSKHYICTSPSGDVYDVWNLAEFSRTHNLHQSAMSGIARGRLTHHKQWVCKYF